MDLLNGRLKLRHLMLVCSIAEHGSVLRAAKALHLAQPAVTRGLRESEHILGVDLFTRGPRGVTPTLFGEAFLEHARAVLAELRLAGDRIEGLVDGQVGTVSVGTLLAGSNVLLPKAIASLKRLRPRVRVIVREAPFDTHLPMLRDGEIDLIVGRLNPIEDQPDLRQIRLYGEPVDVVARVGHPACRLSAPELRDLLGYAWVIPLEQTALRGELEQTFRDGGLPMPEDVVECTSILTVRALVRDADMLAVLPRSVAEGDPGLVRLPLALDGVRHEVGVTLPAKRPLTPSAQLMLRHLREQSAFLAARVADLSWIDSWGDRNDVLWW
ncbi:LysR substrate-binding domain-containing protein [Yinghuangia aomiensis]|uniref:LysR substrate-binding domain-containing protein n=1 Tax=Yinghuangia aomiensis TaxID=676205 RepID=A0ABP9I3Q6_9ACTN